MNSAGTLTAAHIGPIAQDFHALFGLNGPNDKMIPSIDPSGVALAGVKALSQKASTLERTVQDQQQQLDALQAEVQALKAHRSAPHE